MTSQSPSASAPFGLLGRTLGHSWSPRIHSVLGSSPYALIEREPEDVEDFIRRGSWRGINVTIPYKREAALLCDACSERVERLGVANTLVRQSDGTIFADNTDVLGFSWMLERFALRELGMGAAAAFGGHKALVLGSGGASQAVQATLADIGANTQVISRTGTNTYATVAERHADARLVVNTTPVGMYPKCPASPLADDVLARLTKLVGVVDVVYNPERTGLCLAAERRGIPYESGLAMLVAQAYYASQLFQDKALNSDLIERLEAEIRHSTRNVVLIGMPGCGKTSAGRRLARMTGRPFVDLDDSFVVDHGLTPAECIVSRGEKAFRALETKTARTYGAQSGLVIACGGGIVTQPCNYDICHQNGTIVFLDRPLQELTSEDRPLSQAKGVERLAQERMGLYRSWADLKLTCTGSAEGDALAIRELLNL